jgi:hypothetical protein
LLCVGLHIKYYVNYAISKFQYKQVHTSTY